MHTILEEVIAYQKVLILGSLTIYIISTSIVINFFIIVKLLRAYLILCFMSRRNKKKLYTICH